MKRLLDISVSIILLILLSPVFILLAIIIYIKLGSPILFNQNRPGKSAEIFKMYKFRTMTDMRAADGKLLPDADRLTRFGKFLRSTSLDELPELWNVLRGEMSLVGPRPLLIQYLSLYSCEQMRRHDVRPGITGYAQVNGRNTLSWEDKFILDVWYVDNHNLMLDIKILFLTIFRVIKQEGISSEGNATAPPFQGNRRIK